MNDPKMFFIRFYSQTDVKIDECIKKLGLPDLVKIEKVPISTSVNLSLPQETGERKNVEVRLIFQSKAERDAVYKNADNQKVYMKYCHGTPGIAGKAQFELRKPSDVSFFHK